MATSPITPTPNASVFATALMNADIGTTLFEGIGGGAAHKVIRWGFEKQGLYQPAGAPTPVTSEGAPPDVDLYIDDAGLASIPSCPITGPPPRSGTGWRDSGLEHQRPVVGVPNYVYVRIRNRGTQNATGAVAKGYHCRPSTGLRRLLPRCPCRPRGDHAAEAGPRLHAR